MLTWLRKTFLLSVLALLASGCASVLIDMPLSDEAGLPNTDTSPLMLMSMSIKNESGRDITTSLQFLAFQRTDKKGAEPVTVMVRFYRGFDQSQRYLLSLSLPPGDYKLLGASGYAHDGILNSKTFVVPLHLELSGKPNGTHYLGHVEATLRPRLDHEFYAGPEERTGGSIGGLKFSKTSRLSDLTFDVDVQDDMGRDIQYYKSAYPILASKTIEKALLPQFDRAKVEALMPK